MRGWSVSPLLVAAMSGLAAVGAIVARVPGGEVVALLAGLAVLLVQALSVAAPASGD